MQPTTAVSTSRIARGAGIAAAGISAMKLARSDEATVRRNAAAHLAHRLGRLRGLPQKMGQLLSMKAEPGVSDELAALQGTAEPVPFHSLLPVLEEAWQSEPDSHWTEIDDCGLAASLGQVHRAVLTDGRAVAIKMQYPGIREAIERDLKMLGWLSEPLGGLRRGFDLDGYREAIAGSLEEELDYRAEATHQRRYAGLVDGLNIVVPDVIDELSTGTVLVTAWEAGETLAEAATWPLRERQLIARSMVRHLFVCLFDHGWIHADPHPGNYRFRRVEDGEPQLVLYDYGCVRSVDLEPRMALLRLLRDTFAEDSSSDPFALLTMLGFDAELLAPLRHRLPALCRVLFEPFSSPARFDVSTWDRGTRISDILGEDRWNFRISAAPSLIFLMRAFHGLLHAIEILDVSVSWLRLLEPILARHATSMDDLDASPTADATTFDAIARNLHVRVTRDGEVRAKLALPVAAVEDLSSVLDEPVRERIKARGIDLDALIQSVRRQQYAPQEIFDLKDGDGRFEVWLK